MFPSVTYNVVISSCHLRRYHSALCLIALTSDVIGLGLGRRVTISLILVGVIIGVVIGVSYLGGWALERHHIVHRQGISVCVRQALAA
jgi:hypothetical protein